MYYLLLAYYTYNIFITLLITENNITLLSYWYYHDSSCILAVNCVPFKLFYVNCGPGIFKHT